MPQLSDKVALVTGGTAGIGLAIARRFIEEGAFVYITGRRQKELDAAVDSLGSQQQAYRAMSPIPRTSTTSSTSSRRDTVGWTSSS